MRYGLKLAPLWIALALLTVSCFQPSLSLAREPLDETLAGLLPLFESSTLFHTHTEDFVSRVRSKPPEPRCVYARTYLFFGSQQNPVPLLDAVRERLESEGWYVQSMYQDFVGYIRGDNEVLAVEVYNAESFIETWKSRVSAWPGYEVEAQPYQSIMVVQAQYDWPQRDGC